MNGRIVFSLLVYLFLSVPDVSAETRLLRHPDVSGDTIVFSYGGDLWTVGREGGEAKRLTSFQGVETDATFSPDGSMVAFSGQYDGNTDVFVVPVAGGEPRRLTWHPGDDIARGWTNECWPVAPRSWFRPRASTMRPIRGCGSTSNARDASVVDARGGASASSSPT